MGGPSIDGGSYNSNQPDVIRYTPPVPEFEVMIFHVDPGNNLEFENPGVPSIILILEGSGTLDGKLCRPGRSYYWPKDGPKLTFSVDASRRGPMKVALAHKNCHLSSPTAVNRLDFGGSSSHVPTVPASPMPYLGNAPMGGRSPMHINTARGLSPLKSGSGSFRDDEDILADAAKMPAL